MYTNPTQMEPLLPPIEGVPPHIVDGTRKITRIAEEVVRKDAALHHAIHPVTARTVAALVDSMNCYYSNLIEGHGTTPADIEKALNKDFSTNGKQRNMQMLSLAHIRAERMMKQLLRDEPGTDVCSTKFLSWLHKEFYSGMDRSAWGTEDIPDFTPGRIRTPDDTNEGLVTLGHHEGAHVPPVPASLSLFLDKFHRVYTPSDRKTIQERLIMAAASHHRLAWIHPFMDGNGRVTRLFSVAYLHVHCGIGKNGLWSLSRGFARPLEATGQQYKHMMMVADASRKGDLDGRGNLSAQALIDFCEYFLRVTEDQIDFMSKLFEFDAMQDRIRAYVGIALSGKVKPQAEFLLREAFVRGEFERGEAPRITGLPERTARDVLASLIDLGLLASDTPKGVVSMRFPSHSLHFLLPGVFPSPSRPFDHIAEKNKDVGKSEQREFANQMAVLLANLARWEFQPGRQSTILEQTIKTQRDSIDRSISKMPGLKALMADTDWWANTWCDAIMKAAQETEITDADFPDTCPWSQEQILDHDFLPDTGNSPRP